MSRRRTLDVEEVHRILRDFPGVEEEPCYGTVGFRVRRKFLARFWEDGATFVVKCGDEERDDRLRADSSTYFVTKHYEGHSTVLVRLSKISPSDLRDLLEKAWRRIAPKRLIADHDSKNRDR